MERRNSARNHSTCQEVGVGGGEERQKESQLSSSGFSRAPI